MKVFLQIGSLIEPAPVKFSFAAPGWYVLGGLLFVLLLLLGFFMWRNYQRNKYRRKALQWLQEQEKALLPEKQFSALLYAADTLMKRVAVQRYGRDAAASLQGNDWIAFLNKTGKATFDETDIQHLEQLYTEKNIGEQATNLFVNKTKKWIRTHKNKYAVRHEI